MTGIDQLSGGNIEPRELEQEMRSSYLDYAMSVVTMPPCTVSSNPLCSRRAVKRAVARSRATLKSRCRPNGFVRPHAKHQWSKSIPRSASRAI